MRMVIRLPTIRDLAYEVSTTKSKGSSVHLILPQKIISKLQFKSKRLIYGVVSFRALIC